MVKFVRDVIVAVAVLATLIAIAVRADTDTEPKRYGGEIRGPVAAPVTQAMVAPAPPARGATATE
ncbi:MAG: hypothetical protein IT530_04495 [Burkholderiales bacterium]|nr:hypothetical protein [Burkholderiales bacterium]